MYTASCSIMVFRCSQLPFCLRLGYRAACCVTFICLSTFLEAMEIEKVRLRRRPNELPGGELQCFVLLGHWVLELSLSLRMNE